MFDVFGDSFNYTDTFSLFTTFPVDILESFNAHTPMFGVKSLVKQADNYGKDDTLSI